MVRHLSHRPVWNQGKRFHPVLPRCVDHLSSSGRLGIFCFCFVEHIIPAVTNAYTPLTIHVLAKHLTVRLLLKTKCFYPIQYISKARPFAGLACHFVKLYIYILKKMLPAITIKTTTLCLAQLWPKPCY